MTRTVRLPTHWHTEGLGGLGRGVMTAEGGQEDGRWIRERIGYQGWQGVLVLMMGWGQ